jgi:hypothetical protein
MKSFLILISLFILIHLVAAAQDHKADSANQVQIKVANSIPQLSNYRFIGRRALALVVITHGKEYLADTGSMKRVKEKWIKSMIMGGFVADPNDTVKYGTNAANGINRYIIDDDHYPKIYLQFISLMKYIGFVDPNILKN